MPPVWKRDFSTSLGMTVISHILTVTEEDTESQWEDLLKKTFSSSVFKYLFNFPIIELSLKITAEIFSLLNDSIARFRRLSIDS